MNTIKIDKRVLEGDKVTGRVTGLTTLVAPEVSTISNNTRSRTTTKQNFWIVADSGREVFVENPFGVVIAIRDGQDASLVIVGGLPTLLINHATDRQFNLNTPSAILQKLRLHKGNAVWMWSAVIAWLWLYHITTQGNIFFTYCTWAMVAFVLWCWYESSHNFTAKQQKLETFINQMKAAKPVN